MYPSVHVGRYRIRPGRATGSTKRPYTPRPTESGRAMTARKLIQLLEAVPPNTRVPVEPAVISALKEKSAPQYVSEREQDKIDGAILRRRSKHPKYVPWEYVKRRYGLR